jgi:2-haloacid dehalogenase
MKYKLFLFDLDDTLLDFQASEALCFKETLAHFNIQIPFEMIHETYRRENSRLWKQIEKGEIDKDFLKVERFKRTLESHNLEAPPSAMADFYLEQLPRNVVLIPGAIEICQFLKTFGDIGIITNGIEVTQRERIKNSGIAELIDFLAVSEECGFAKPDVRFFEFATNKARYFTKDTTIIIGDRIEADILGANRFGIDSCWFNPHKAESINDIHPTFIIENLSELKTILG